MNSQDNIKDSVSRHLSTLKERALRLAEDNKKSPDQCKHEHLLESLENVQRKALGNYGKHYSGIALLGRVFYYCDRLAFSIDCEDSYDLIGQLIKITKSLSTARSKLHATMRMAVNVKRGKKQTLKQQEKKIVEECWIEWQDNPSQYKSNSTFANAMLKKFEPDDPADQDKHLSSAKVISDWCTDWKKKPPRKSKRPG